ncbi:MAG: GtrA family protein [Croceibacterium sp.]
MHDTSPYRRRGLWSRLTSFRVGKMLARNTVVSCFVFVVGLGVLWVMVSQLGMNKTVSAGASFMVANSLHYLIGRSWIFKGSDRPFGSGFLFFLLNALVGLVVTMALFELLVRYTPIHYLAARALVSLAAGLLIFVLNAVFNFRKV